MPFSIESLRHYFDLLDQALARGSLTLVFDNERALITARHRLNAARSLDRKLSLQHAPDSPAYGVTIYDAIAISRDDLKLILRVSPLPIPGLKEIL